MKKLSLFENILFQAGGILMLIGAVCYIVPAVTFYSPIIFSVGAVCYACMQMLMRYDGAQLVLKRLRRQQLMSDVLLIAAAGLLMMNVWNFGPLRGDAWKIILAIAAILQLYTAFRIPAELKKDK